MSVCYAHALPFQQCRKYRATAAAAATAAFTAVAVFAADTTSANYVVLVLVLAVQRVVSHVPLSAAASQDIHTQSHTHTHTQIQSNCTFYKRHVQAW